MTAAGPASRASTPPHRRAAVAWLAVGSVAAVVLLVLGPIAATSRKS